MKVRANRARVETLFHRALELPPESWEHFLDIECGSDTVLRNEVASLLAHYDDPRLTLDHPIAPPDSLVLHLFSLQESNLEPGELLAARFRIVKPLASGGMGDVYEAEDTQLEEHVALKTIRAEIAAHPRILARFKQEVQLAKRVSHPNVCRIHDLGIGECASGAITFLTMELLDGETLAHHLTQNPLSLDEIRNIASQIAAGLDAAHAAHVVHRDLKSNNVMLTRTQDLQLRVVITDFGIAHAANRESFSDGLTRTGEIIGTPDYMAPEQLLGQPATHLTDIYAFGIILFEMVAGRLPFAGMTPHAAIAQRINGLTSSPALFAPALPKSWERAIMRCMDPDPAARFQTAGDVVSALETEPAASRKLTTFFRVHRARAVLFAGLVLLTAALVVWTVSRVRFRAHAPIEPPSPVALTGAQQSANMHYQRGVYYWNLRTQDAFLKAIDEYKAAIRQDPQFAPAHAGLAWVLAMQSGFKPPRQVFHEAKQYAEAAIKLDNRLAPAHAALAFVRFYYDWDWQGAEDEFRTAIKLEPNYGSAHSNYAVLLSVRKRFDEAVEEAKLAEQADPVSAAVATGLGRVYYWSGRYQDAVDQFRRVLSMHPQFTEAHLSMATALEASNNSDAAVRQISYVLAESLNTGAMADLACMYARMGDRDLARSMLLKLENLRYENKRYVSPCYLAIAYGALGERDQAFTLLDQGFKERTFEMVYLTLNPEYGTLSHDARWRRIVQKVGLAQ